MKFLVFLVTIISFFVYYDQDIIWPAWCLIVLGLAVFGIWQAVSDIEIPFVMIELAGWVAINALFLIEFKPATASPHIDIAQIMATKSLMETALVEFLVISLVFVLFFKKLRTPLADAFYVIGLAHAVSLIIDQVIFRIPTGSAQIGFLGNRSIGASFAAVWVFFTLHYANEMEPHRWLQNRKVVAWSSLVGVLAVIVSSSGISYVALLLGGLALVLCHRPRLFPWAIAGFIGLVSLGGFIKPTFFRDNPRYVAWPVFWQFWKDHFDWMFGSGLGTFRWWGPAAQIEHSFNVGHWWLWAHNDWLQIYFELGAIGLGCALFFYGDVLLKTVSRPWLFAAAIAVGVTMLGNYDLHVPQFALFIWFLSFESLVGDEDAV